jgi:hypothetical protein
VPAALLLQHGGRRQAYAGHHSTQVDVERGLITGRVGGEEIATLANACHQQCSIQAPIPDGLGGSGGWVWMVAQGWWAGRTVLRLRIESNRQVEVGTCRTENDSTKV